MASLVEINREVAVKKAGSRGVLWNSCKVCTVLTYFIEEVENGDIGPYLPLGCIVAASILHLPPSGKLGGIGS